MDVRDSYCLSFYKYWNLLQDKILKHSLNRTGVGACSSLEYILTTCPLSCKQICHHVRSALSPVLRDLFRGQKDMQRCPLPTLSNLHVTLL